MLLAEDNPEYRINYYYDSSDVATELGYINKDNGKYVKEEYFFFTRNGQGDIVGIYRSSDSKRMGTYEYDLWENVVTVKATADDTIGITDKNPLRYRGYYYLINMKKTLGKYEVAKDDKFEFYYGDA